MSDPADDVMIKDPMQRDNIPRVQVDLDTFARPKI